MKTESSPTATSELEQPSTPPIGHLWAFQVLRQSVTQEQCTEAATSGKGHADRDDLGQPGI